MIRKLKLIVASTLLMSAHLNAATQLEKVLLPIVIETPIPGAFGSLWSSDVSMYYGGDMPLLVGGTLICHISSCNGEALAPKQVYRQVPIPMAQNAVGKFLYVPPDSLNDLAIYLRVFDISRAATNRGTQIPTIPELTAARTNIELLSVAIASPYRSLVRVYDFDPDPTHSVLVSIFSGDSGEGGLLDRRTVLFRQPADPSQYPGYAELDLSYLAGNVPHVRVEVAPATTGLRFWALASTTNNDTQFVTLTTP